MAPAHGVQRLSGAGLLSVEFVTAAPGARRARGCVHSTATQEWASLSFRKHPGDQTQRGAHVHGPAKERPMWCQEPLDQRRQHGAGFFA